MEYAIDRWIPYIWGVSKGDLVFVVPSCYVLFVGNANGVRKTVYGSLDLHLTVVGTCFHLLRARGREGGDVATRTEEHRQISD